MSRIASNWRIGRSTGACAATGEAIPIGSPCIATLCESSSEDAFERHDYSIAAWEQGSRPARMIAAWRSVVAEPGTARKMFVDDEVLLDVWERLAADDRPHRVAFRFVLTLVLLRKRLLRSAGRRHEGNAEFWLVSRRGAPPEAPPAEVFNPNLSEDALRDIADQLGEILEGEA